LQSTAVITTAILRATAGLGWAGPGRFLGLTVAKWYVCCGSWVV